MKKAYKISMIFTGIFVCAFGVGFGVGNMLQNDDPPRTGLAQDINNHFGKIVRERHPQP